jgi:hypothetical protein
MDKEDITNPIHLMNPVTNRALMPLYELLYLRHLLPAGFTRSLDPPNQENV